MVTINGAIEYPTISIIEGYREEQEEWKKILVVRFPKAEFSEETAEEIAREAMSIEQTTRNKVVKYFVNGIIDKKANDFCTDIWLLNPEVEVEDNLLTKLEEMEIVLENLLGGEEE